MTNKNGNVIALVLLILAVVSLIGAGSLVISRYDMKLTAAVMKYDKAFNIADGAALIAYKDLGKIDREQDATFTGTADVDFTRSFASQVTGIVFCHRKNPAECTGALRNENNDDHRCIDRRQGDFDVKQLIVGYDTGLKEGWEAGTYFEEQWVGIGVSYPAGQTIVNNEIETDVTKQKAK